MPFFRKLIESGIIQGLSTEEIKKIKILNIIGLLAIVNCSFFIVLDLLQSNWSVAGGTTIGLFFILTTLYLQKVQKYTIARVMLMIAGFGYFFANANFLFVGKLSEFFYLMILFLAMIFFDALWVHIVTLVICLVSFYLPNIVWEIYSPEVFGYANMGFLFFSIFLMILHFKKLNKTNEEQLALQNEKIEKHRKELIVKNDSIEKINELQSKFLLHFSHELKNPLTILNGYIDTLPNDSIQAENNKEHLFLQAKNIEKLSNDLLNLATAQSSELQLHLNVYEIGELVKNIYYQFMDEFTRKKISLELLDNSKSAFITTDRVHFMRVIHNLLSNALKYSESETSVFLEVSIENNEVVLLVKDEGIGISEKHLPSIFDQFYRVPQTNQHGTGVGLTYVKEIVGKLGGSILAESKENIGTTFKLKFPIVENVPQLEKGIDDKTLKTTKILVVEDNIELLKYLTDSLSNFNITTSANGKDALEKLENTVFDLIISDYMMPQMNGLELVEELQKKQLSVPIIILTAVENTEIKQSFLRLGVDEIMPKPFNKEELLIRINRLIHRNTLVFTESEATNSFEKQLKKLIKEQMKDETIKIDDLADRMNMSLRSFQRKTKETTGLSAIALIKEEKLMRMQYLIENGRVGSVKELCANTGYKNSSYVSSMYEKRFGKKIIFKN